MTPRRSQTAPARRLPQVDCCLVVFYVVHDLREGGGSLRPPGAAAPPKNLTRPFQSGAQGRPRSAVTDPWMSRGVMLVSGSKRGEQGGRKVLWRSGSTIWSSCEISRFRGSTVLLMPTDARERHARVQRPRVVDVEADAVVEGAGRGVGENREDLDGWSSSRYREISKYRESKSAARWAAGQARALWKEQVEHPPPSR